MSLTVIAAATLPNCLAEVTERIVAGSPPLALET